jgi:chemotaxis protein CheZ
MKSLNHKPYTAELQNLDRREREKGVRGVAMTQTDRALADLCRVVETLRQEVGSIRDEFRHRAGEAPPPADDGKTLPGQEVSSLKTEIRALAFCIEQTKSEIAALRSDDSDVDHLNSVASELDAVVSSTEGATQQILEASERIEALAREMRPHISDNFAGRILEDLLECTTSIFEACNFQDITGQRITKVVRTLQYVDGRINSMIDIWGSDTFAAMRPQHPESVVADEARLLNGPQLGDGGISQEDIDKLFS